MTHHTHTSGAADLPAIQRYKIGYHSDDWGQRSSTPSGIPDASGSWVRYADHVAALAAGQAVAPATQPAVLSRGVIRDIFMAHGFTVKEGQTDLKEYVYAAAYSLFAATRPAPPAMDGGEVEDAARYQLVRRGQHWSVIDGIGNYLRGEALDAAVDTVRSKKGGAA